MDTSPYATVKGACGSEPTLVVHAGHQAPTELLVSDVCPGNGAVVQTGATVTASKGALGHTLGAAGGLGAIATICAMRDGRVHHTLNLADPDPAAAGLDIVRGAPRERRRIVARGCSRAPRVPWR